MNTTNCLVAQSGGPTAVINSSLYGVISEAQKSQHFNSIFGSLYGINGLLEGKLVDLNQVPDALLARLQQTPGAGLGGCRTQIKSATQAKRVIDALAAHNIHHFFYIGGNDSMDTAQKIHEAAQAAGYELQVVGIPKTIDNDLLHTDHTPGYGSAAKYVAASVMEAGLHAASMGPYEPVTLLETVGRNTGWLPGASALARREAGDAPHLIYLPEKPFRWERFFNDVANTHQRQGTVFIVCGEGLRDEHGAYIASKDAEVALDDFGHPLLGGLTQTLAQAIEKELKLKARSIKLDVCQQSAMHFASSVDVEEAALAGRYAVQSALQRRGGHMVVFERGDPYECRTSLVELSKVANQERMVPQEWIHPEGNFVTPQFVDFVKPLIQGEVAVPLKAGLPDYPRFLSTFESLLDPPSSH